MPESTTVMLVDDEEDILKISERFLTESGYQVHVFNDPLTALNHVANGNCNQCSIVISDIKMPGMSGFELVRQIKEVRPQMKTMLTTSFVIEKKEFEKVLPSMKVDGFIGKPFSKADLVEAITKCFQTE